MSVLQKFWKQSDELKLKYPCPCDTKYYQTKMIKLYMNQDKTAMKNAEPYLNDPLLKGAINATKSYVGSTISWIPGAQTIADITWRASESYMFPPIYAVVFDCKCRKCSKCFSISAQCVDGKKSLTLMSDEDSGKLEDLMHRKFDFKIILKRYEKMPSLKDSEEWARISYGQFK